ncbi:hypothetical protein CE195_05790 [Sodalis-like symbiont of Philaenus spumarius]|nr:hypothetical protein CE195_05790 [Sodalis-like symbiont of Philaenus spumarius]
MGLIEAIETYQSISGFHVITVSVHCPRCHSDEIYRHSLRAC